MENTFYGVCSGLSCQPKIFVTNNAKFHYFVCLLTFMPTFMLSKNILRFSDIYWGKFHFCVASLLWPRLLTFMLSRKILKLSFTNKKNFLFYLASLFWLGLPTFMLTRNILRFFVTTVIAEKSIFRNWTRLLSSSHQETS